MKFCKKCGTKIPDESAFCPECGEKVEATPVQAPQPQYSQPQYAQPQYMQHVQPQYVQQPVSRSMPSAVPGGYNPLTEPLTVGSYFGMMFLLCIPIVGFILLLVWAFSSSTNLNRKNFARASLIWGLIAVALSIVVSLLGVSLGASLLNGLSLM